MATLLEGFESRTGTGPWSATLTWGDPYGNSPTVTLSSAHATQGINGWRLQIASIFGGIGIGTGALLGFATVNLSTFSNLKVDFFGVTVPAGTALNLTVLASDFSGQLVTSSAAGFTGATTLELDLTAAEFDRSDVNIIIGADNAGAEIEGAVDIFFDNLRVDDFSGGGTPVAVFAHHLRTQGIS